MKNLLKIFVVIIANSTLLIINCSAADRFWIAGSTADWNSTANWSTTSGGSGGASVPGNSDVAKFDGSGTGSCTINATVNVAGMDIGSGYSGTISQGSYVMTVGSSHFTMAGGTFAGGSSNIDVNGRFTLSGGDFTATSANFYIGGSISNSTIFTHSGGTFNHNNGVLIFDAYQGTDNTYTIDIINGTTSFYNVSDNCSPYAIFIAAAGDTIDIENNFTHYSGRLNGVWSMEGNLTVGTSSGGGTGTIIFTGTANQTYTYGASGRTANILINKPSGSVNPESGTTNFATMTFKLASGTFTAPSGNFFAGGLQNSNATVFSHSGGTFNHNNGTVVFDGMNGGGGYTYTVDVLTGTQFYNALGNNYPYSTLTPASGDTIKLLNDFTHKHGYLNGIWSLQGNLTVNTTAQGGTGTLIFTGTANQSYTYTTSGKTAGVKIDKTAGTVSAASGTTNFSSGAFTLISGTFTAPSGIFYAGGAQPASAIFTHSGGTFNHNNGTVVFDASNGGAGYTYTVDVLNGTQFYNALGSNNPYCNLTSATGDTVKMLNNFTHKQGAINGTWSLQGNLSVNTTAQGGTGTIIFTGTANQTYAYSTSGRTIKLRIDKASGTVNPASGTTAFSCMGLNLAAGSFTATTGIFNIGGTPGAATIFDYSAGTFNHNNGMVFFNPTDYYSNQTIHTSSINFYDVKIHTYSTLFQSSSSDTLKVDNELTLFGGTYSTGVTAVKGKVKVGSSYGNTQLLFCGSSDQDFDLTGATGNYNGLIKIKKPSGKVNLLSACVLDASSQTLTFVKGNIATTATNLLTLGDNVTVSGMSDSGYVAGPMKKTGNDAFTFPVGKNGHYRKIGISAPANTTDAYTAEYFEQNSNDTYSHSAKDGSIAELSRNEYWNLARTTGTSNVSVTLSIDSATSCAVDNLSNLKVAAWDGSTWKDKGNGGTTGNVYVGTVVSNGVSGVFGAYSVGTSMSLDCGTLDFDWQPDTIYVGDTVVFDNISTGFHYYQQYLWYFEDCYLNDPLAFCDGIDTTTGINQDVNHIYYFQGTYDVVLKTIIGDDTLSVTKTLTVLPIAATTQTCNPECLVEDPNPCDLVCNGDFEYSTSCVNWFYVIDLAAPWCGQGTSDYFNSDFCPAPGLGGANYSVPNNTFGSQASHNSGQAYSAGSFYSVGGITSDYREYIKQPLNSALVADETYYVSFYVSLAEQSGYAIDAIGAYFSNGEPSTCMNCLLNVTPQVSNPTNNIITDTDNWVEISGTYTPTSSGEDWIIIGSFTSDVNTNAIPSIGSNIWSYYYIDDVSVTFLEPVINEEDQTICEGESINLSYSVGTSGFSTITWSASPSDPSLSGQENNSTITVSPTETTVYTITTNEFHDCSVTDIITVTVNPTPDPVTVSGNVNSTCDATTPVFSTEEGLYSYTWTVPSDATIVSGQGTNEIEVDWGSGTAFLNGGDVCVTIENEYGCITTDCFYVKGCCVIGSYPNLEHGTQYTGGSTLGGMTVTSGVLTGETFSINGLFVVADDLTFDNCDVSLGEDAVIYVAPSVTFTITDNSHLQACNKMWAMIYMGFGSTLTVNGNSLIEDAKVAVYRMAQSYLDIDEAVFNKNLIHVYMYPNTTPNEYSSSIINSDFLCQNTESITGTDPITYENLNEPHQDNKTWVGIWVNNVTSITIGDENEGNLIENANFGLYGYNSNLTSLNNTYKSMLTDDDCPGFPCGTGVYSNSSNILNVTKQNKFEDCHTGVFAYNPATSVSVEGNNETGDGGFSNPTLEAITAGIQVHGAPSKSYPNLDVAINNNTIEEVTIGIRTLNLPSSLIEIGEDIANEITVRPETFTFNLLGANFTVEAGTGIMAEEAQALTATRVKLNHNTVNNAVNGIWMRNMNFNTEVIDNTVSIEGDLNYTNGILGQNINVTYIMDNLITSPDVTQYRSGIRPDIGAWNLIQCNTTEVVGRGIYLRGALTPCFLFNNEMSDNAVTGLYLDGLLNNIGTSAFGWDNTWTTVPGNADHTFNNTQAGPYNVYYSAGGSYQPTINGETYQTFAFSAVSATNGLPSQYDCPSENGSGMVGTVGDQKILVLDALNDTVIQPVYDEEGKWMRKLGLYTVLLENDSVRESDAVIEAFYDSCFTANVGKLMRANDAFRGMKVVGETWVPTISTELAEEYLDTLDNLTTSIVPEDALRDVLKVALEKYLDTTVVVDSMSYRITGLLQELFPDSSFEFTEYKNPYYTNSQLTTLASIAQQCPYEYGTAVYMARVMLSQNDSIPNLYYNDCEAVADTGSGKWDGNNDHEPQVEQPEDLTNDKAEFVLYPNPNDGNMYLQYKNLSAIARFELYDVAGRKLCIYKLSEANGQLNINQSSLTQGVYFYRIIDDTRKLKFGKIIISK